MCGATFSPASTAFFASRPAASSTPGLLVLVQEVMAAISTSPFLMLKSSPALKLCASLAGGWLKPFSATGLLNSSPNFFDRCVISMRSCGRFGPARLGTTVARSSFTVFV